MILLGEQLLAERVESDELPGEGARVDETLGNQHDLANELKVRHHHGARPEQRLQVFRQLSPTRVAGGGEGGGGGRQVGEQEEKAGERFLFFCYQMV